MISIYFGLPGSGKTTLLSAHALSAIKKGITVYSNIPLAIDGVYNIGNSCFGKYDLHDALCLIDEGTIFADSRDFKNFPKYLVEWVLMHRHDNLNIEIFIQHWDSLDKKIRTVAERVFWVKRGLFGTSKIIRIPYGLSFPVYNQEEDHSLIKRRRYGEICMGYCEPSLISRIIAPRIIRRRYYRYFDSFSRIYRPPLPPVYLPYSSEKKEK